MSFARYDDKGKPIRNSVVLDCQKAHKDGEPYLVEQSHKAECNINKIIKRHGLDIVSKVTAMRSHLYQFDDVTGNDFQEAMNIIIKAQDEFESMPSQLRKQFDNDPAKFLDFVQNPDNMPVMVEMGPADRDWETLPVTSSN